MYCTVYCLSRLKSESLTSDARSLTRKIVLLYTVQYCKNTFYVVWQGCFIIQDSGFITHHSSLITINVVIVDDCWHLSKSFEPLPAQYNYNL